MYIQSELNKPNERENVKCKHKEGTKKWISSGRKTSRIKINRWDLVALQSFYSNT